MEKYFHIGANAGGSYAIMKLYPQNPKQTPDLNDNGGKRMKNWKNILALLLALTLALGLVASAAAVDRVPKHYDTYTVLGDSIAAGYGLDTYPVPEPEILDGTRVEGSYPDLLGKAVGCNTYYNMAHCGNRAVDLYWLLDNEAPGDGLTVYYLASAMGIDVSTEEKLAEAMPAFQALRDETQAAVKDADLITVNVGNNDTLTFAITMWAIEVSQNTDTPDETTQKLKEMLMKVPGVSDIITGLDAVTNTTEMLQTLLKYAAMGVESFKENWDNAIRAIRALNPDATIVAVGMYNPFNEVKLTKNGVLPVGRLMSAAVLPINLHMQYQSAVRSEYLFADVRDPEVHEMESFIDESGSLMTFLGSLRHGTHPTANGHQFIFEKILALLPTEEAPVEPTTEPTAEPTVQPTAEPTAQPTAEPTAQPTAEPTAQPTAEPTAQPTAEPTAKPVKDLPFTDVKKTDWSYGDIAYVYENGLMQGKSATIFDPKGTTTRAEFATVIYRMAGSPKVTAAMRNGCMFRDLAADWYKDPVIWAYSTGVVKGTSDSTFSPNDQITREQMVAMLYRYSKAADAQSDLSKIKDAASITEYAKPAVAWAVKNGVVNGFEDGTFRPQGNATREQMAAIMARFDKLGK